MHCRQNGILVMRVLVLIRVKSQMVIARVGVRATIINKGISCYRGKVCTINIVPADREIVCCARSHASVTVEFLCPAFGRNGNSFALGGESIFNFIELVFVAGGDNLHIVSGGGIKLVDGDRILCRRGSGHTGVFSGIFGNGVLLHIDLPCLVAVAGSPAEGSLMSFDIAKDKGCRSTAGFEGGETHGVAGGAGSAVAVTFHAHHILGLRIQSGDSVRIASNTALKRVPGIGGSIFCRDGDVVETYAVTVVIVIPRGFKANLIIGGHASQRNSFCNPRRLC